MESPQNTNPFDALLKQSLENSQMPVPSGVWETVGSSLGSQVILTAKMASLKLLVFKSVAGIILTGAVGLGIYTLIPDPTKQANPSIAIQNQTASPENISNEPLINSQETPQLASPAKPLQSKAEPTKNPDQSFTVIIPEAPAIKSFENTEKPNSERHIIPVTPIIPKYAIEEKKEIIPTIDKTTNNINTVFPEPVNVFTPDGDGINDYFYIEVENEKVFNLQIFNDQGQKVFETNDKNKVWDGKNSTTGEPCTKGTYIYTYYYELQSGFKKKDRSILTIF